MPQFMATTSRGLLDVLETEMKDLGLQTQGRDTTGVFFEGNWADCYRANLHLRTANRVIKPLLDFPAYQLEDLYHNTLKHDFTKYIDVDQTFAIDAVVKDSKIRDQRMVALKVKDAIADQFTNKFERRPNVDSENPDMKIMVRVVKNQVSFALDTSGPSLNQRGYRQKTGVAPLRETVAAGLLKLSKWEPGIPLYDPMCGSGTILIEAALMTYKIAPGTLRKSFSFQKFKGFQDDVWQGLVSEALDNEIEIPEIDPDEMPEEREVEFFGSDLDREVLKAARTNLRNVGLDALIKVARRSVQEIEMPLGMTKPGWIITNPPYGERMGVDEQLLDVYRDLSYSLKQNFPGWKLWVLSGNERLTGALKMKAENSFPCYNGNISCRFLGYPIKA